MSMRTLIGVGGRLMASALIAAPVYWVNGVLLISPTWNSFLLLAIGLSALLLIWRLPEDVGGSLVISDRRRRCC